MSNHLDLMIEKMGFVGEREPYLPFLAAREAGIITDAHKMATPPEDTPGVLLANLTIPSCHSAGIIPANDRHVAAFDLVACVMEGERLRILPAEKSAVTHEGRIIAEGLVPIEREDGLIKIAGFVIDAVKRPWILQRYKNNLRVGQLARQLVYIPLGINSPMYEAREITVDGEIEALPIRNYD